MSKEKYAIYIVDRATGERKLFAVCENKNGQVYRHHALARGTFTFGSSNSISMRKWELEV